MRDTTAELQAWLENGGRTIGQIAITAHTAHASAWELRHADDAKREDLVLHERWEDARMLANLDDSASYRALKTAPTLRHGWRLLVGSIEELHRALDYFYPAMLGIWLAQKSHALEPVCFRDTLGRQTGMYRVTQKITDDQAQQLIGRVCHPDSCIKTILWPVSPGISIATLPEEKFIPAKSEASWPLLCHEACNLLVAAARKVVKGEM